MKRILLVEDDDSLGETLKERLTKEGYGVDWAKSAADAVKIFAKTQKFDLAVLDVGLPDGSGFDLAKKIRVNGSVPFLFITAMATAEYRLQGYELGAEEYIPKPFHLKEFLLRVRHVLENHGAQRALKIGSRTVDFERMSVMDKGGKVEYLANKDCLVLQLLVDAAPNVVRRDEILEKVWGNDKFPTNRTVDNSILRIRQVLGDENSDYIRTVRGVGYQFVSEGAG